MLLEPISTENIIVGVRWNGHFSWYVTMKDLWFMDSEKLKAAYIKKFEESGIPLSNLDFGEDEPERQEIPLLDENTFIKFEPRIKKYLVTANELKENLKLSIGVNSLENVFYDFLPSLYLDFDRNCLYSLYTEPASFEELAPSNWTAEYYDFLNLIEEEQRYWYDNGELIIDFRKGDGNIVTQGDGSCNSRGRF